MPPSFKSQWLWILLAVNAPAAPVLVLDPYGAGSADVYLPGPGTGEKDVIGSLSLFDIESARFDLTPGSVLIRTNYGGGASLAGFTAAGLLLQVGDVLFTGAQHRWAIALTDRGGAQAGHLYRVGRFRTAREVLGDPQGVLYRPGEDVWMGEILALAGAGSVAVGGSGLPYEISIQFNPSAEFLADMNTPGARFHFAVATCANDILTHTLQPENADTPEPPSLALLAAGAAVLAATRRRPGPRAMLCLGFPCVTSSSSAPAAPGIPPPSTLRAPT